MTGEALLLCPLPYRGHGNSTPTKASGLSHIVLISTYRRLYVGMRQSVNDTESAFTPADVAGRLGISTRTLAEMRRRETGPDYIKLGHRTIRYPRAAFHAWLEATHAPRPLTPADCDNAELAAAFLGVTVEELRAACAAATDHPRTDPQEG